MVNSNEIRLNLGSKDFIDCILYGDKKDEYKKLESLAELHYFALNYNWDNGIEPIKWLIRNPKLDRGTALLLYWNFDPMALTNLSPDENNKIGMEHLTLMKELEEKYVSDFYHNKKIRFDPIKDGGINRVMVYKIKKGLYSIPSVMTLATTGNDFSIF